MKKLLALPLVLLTLLIAGCGTVSVDSYKDREPIFQIEDYFIGTTRAWGIFQDRSGMVQRQFTVDIEGYMDGDELVLEEDFVYDDGELDRRVWRIRNLGDGNYEGRADDVVGTATGRASGNALNWAYTLDLPYRDGTVEVQFDDWMFLQPDGVLLNRARMSKFGVRLGEVTLVFQKRDAAAQDHSGMEAAAEDASSDEVLPTPEEAVPEDAVQ